MAEPKFDYPTVDTECGIQQFGDVDTLVLMLENFVSNFMGQELTSIQQHLKDDPDYKQLRFYAHRIKGSSSMVGATRMQKITGQMETLALNFNYDEYKIHYKLLLEEANNLRSECERLKHRDDADHVMTIIPYSIFNLKSV